MELHEIKLERYKCFESETTFEIAPLTILVGSNNSGKTALLQAIHLLSSSMAARKGDSYEFLNLNSDGIRHAKSFRDLVSGRALHGSLRMTAILHNCGKQIKLSFKVQNVVEPTNPFESEQRILFWSLTCGEESFEATCENLESKYHYNISGSGVTRQKLLIRWQGVLPKTSDRLPNWLNEQVVAMGKWSRKIRYVKSPRVFQSSALSLDRSFSRVQRSAIAGAPFMLAKSDHLRNSIKQWYRSVFGVSLDIKMQGEFFDLAIGSKSYSANVLLEQSGEGLSQVLPVAVMAFTSGSIVSGVDLIEHPEADLHPAAHAHVAELLLDSLSRSKRPIIVETHSEMILLRVRRWIAEGRLPANRALIYWVHTKPGYGSHLEKITINERGTVSSWPEGVFIEDYEEVLAIRRALRDAG